MKTTRGWGLIATFFVLLIGVSGVGLLAPPLHTREGRWGVGLALANLTVVVLGCGVTWFAYRKGQSWAWWVVLAAGLCYGVPMALIDHLTVGWLGPVSVLEGLLVGVWMAGLWLGRDDLVRVQREPADDADPG